MKVCALFLCHFAAVAVGVSAGEISTPEFPEASLIGLYSPMGQSFTAEDSRISSIGFLLSDFNPQSGDTVLTYELFRGVGFDGPSLGRASVNLVANQTQWGDTDFSFVSLTIGQQYSIEIEGSIERWGVHNFDNWIPYSGGTALLGGQIWSDYFGNNFVSELCFRVEPIPEPRPVFLSVLGLLLLAVVLAKRDTNKRVEQNRRPALRFRSPVVQFDRSRSLAEHVSGGGRSPVSFVAVNK